MVFLREAIVLSVIQHCCPVVVARRNGCAQRNGNLFKAKLVSQLLCYRLIAFLVELAAVNIRVFCLNAEYVLCILLVGDANINVLAQIGHCCTRFVTGPQLAAIVQVAGNLDAALLGCLARITADFHNICAQCRCDAGKV